MGGPASLLEGGSTAEGWFSRCAQPILQTLMPSPRRRPGPSDFRHLERKTLGPGLRRDDDEY
jgi:hypothetical protein